MTRDLRTAAILLEGEVSGGQILCPGPGHSPRDRSLAVKFSPSAPEGFICESHAGDDWQTCRDHVRARLGIVAQLAPVSNQQHPDKLRKLSAVSNQQPHQKMRQLGAVSDVDRITRARSLWDEARDPRNTIVERYLLEERGLRLPENVAGTVLRFHPSCPWKGDDGRTLRVPCMVAAMRSIDGDTITAVHRTRLTPDGRKVDRRMLGKASGSAIKLDADDAVCQGLIIGEGVETCLAARQIGLRPVWALGSVGAIATFPTLASVDALTILAESDATGANDRAITQCGDRWNAAERGVIVAAPKFGGDVNDAILTRRAS